MLKVSDLFAGLGGSSTGAQMAGAVVASNSETDAAKALYADFTITSITARRSVSAKAASRAAAGEIIATMRATA
ncbi:hypothetical protein [Serratia marcescens]|uniref:hypothetical protein n=1 Tax=Serratia marcescens TaxID=615 RepID=UPI0016503EFE|nr:hypothetical protein [Serratia marcescens]